MRSCLHHAIPNGRMVVGHGCLNGKCLVGWVWHVGEGMCLMGLVL